MTTLGDIIYGGSSPAGQGTRLAGSTSATKNFLTQTGNGTVSAAPAWGTIALGDRILVKDQTTGFQNGLYDVTTAGAAGATAVLTRNVNMDTTAEFPTSFIPVEDAGTVNSNSLWLCTNSANPTVGTTAIVFTQLNKGTDLAAGTGITISGNTVSLTSGIATPGTYSSVTVDTYGRVTTGADIITSNGIVTRTASGS